MRIIDRQRGVERYATLRVGIAEDQEIHADRRVRPLTWLDVLRPHRRCSHEVHKRKERSARQQARAAASEYVATDYKPDPCAWSLP